MDFQEELDVKELFHIVKKRWWIIALVTVTAIIASAVVSFFVLDAVYESSTTMLVGKSQSDLEEVQYNDVMLYQRLVKTYGEIAKRRIILDQVVTNLSLPITAEQLAQKMTVNPVGETELFQIKVIDPSPEQAAKIANEIASVFRYKIKDIMPVNNVSVIDRAQMPQAPIKPNKMLNIAIAAVLGMMVSIFIIFLMEYFDNTMKTPADVARHLDLPVLGAIPQAEK